MALDLIGELERLVVAFDDAGIEYALCGGLAVAIHGHPRATMDIDLLMRSESIATALVVAKGLGFDIPARKMVFGLRKGTPREMQRVSQLDPETGELMSLDLLVVAPDLEVVWTSRIRIPWRGREIGIVSRDGLAIMKRMAGRLQDLADLAALEGTNDDDEA